MVTIWLGKASHTPPGQLRDGGPEATAVAGECIDRAGDGRGEHLAFHDAGGFELFEPSGQESWGDRTEPVLQVRVALRPAEQLANDQQRPALADDVEGVGEWAVLLIRTSRHARKLAELLHLQDESLQNQ